MTEVILGTAAVLGCCALYGWVLVKGHPVLRIAVSLVVIVFVAMVASWFSKGQERNRICQDFGRPLSEILYFTDLHLRDKEYQTARQIIGGLDSDMIWKGIVGSPDFGSFYLRCRELPGQTAGDHQPDGAANGSQPIRSETNRTSSAAGSRR